MARGRPETSVATTAAHCYLTDARCASLARSGLAAEDPMGDVGGRALLDASETECIILPVGEWTVRSLTGEFLPQGASASSHRALRVGPFMLSVPVHADRSYRLSLEELDAAFGAIPVRPGIRIYISGSQSPLSVKLPHAGSDIDLLVVVEPPDAHLSEGHDVVTKLPSSPAGRYSANISPGLVLRSWLQLPGFYEALDLHSREDRQWWSRGPESCAREAALRLERGIRFLASGETVHQVLLETLEQYAVPHLLPKVQSLMVTPRWISMEPASFAARAQGVA